MERLRIRLFGGFEARVGDGPPLRLPTRKTQALLAYLAVQQGQPTSRDKLAGLLWGGSSDQQARQSLRQALYWIRRAVADAGGPTDILGDGDGLTLEPAAAEVDATQFQALAREPRREALDAAIALYRGDLLDGLAPEDPVFEEWLRAERERLRELALETLRRAMELHAAADALEAAIHCAGRLLALDPLQEAVHRALMRLQTRSGRRAAALRQYQLCADIVRRELGTDPEPETRALYQALLRDAGESHAATPALPATAPVSAAAPLVGRRDELAQLRAAMQDAWRGRCLVVALTGEAGIGKTRLLDEVLVAAAADGARVLVGHAHEMGRDLPFAPMIAALRSGSGRPDAAASEISPGLREHLHRLLPELWDSTGAPAGDDRPQALFEAVAQWLESLAGGAPLLLALEDLHWADDATIRLLAFLAHRLGGLPLLLLLSAREEELAEDGAARRLLRDLAIKRRLVTVGLDRLSGIATSALVRALGKQRLARTTLARLAQRVWRQSEGNPFMIVELVHAALEPGASQRARAATLPDRVQALVEARLQRLSPEARQMVEVAATVGGSFEFDLVQRASAMVPAVAAEALDELVRRRVLVTGDGALAFGHEQIRAVAYARLITAKRQLLHRAVAEAMQAASGEVAADVADMADRLAYHFGRAGDVERATRYLLQAAGTARHRYALDVTLKLLDQALEHVEAAGIAGREPRWLEVMLRKAQILSIFGRFKEVFGLLLPHRARLDALGDAKLSGPYHARLALTHAQIGSARAAEAEARLALAYADRCDDDAVRGHAHYALGVSGWFSGNTRDGVAYADDAARCFERRGERGMAGLAYWILGLNHQLRGAFPEALAAAGRAAEIAAALDEPALGSRAAWTLALVEATRGEADAAIAHAGRALDQAISHPANRATALAVRGQAYLDRGEIDAAVADFEAATANLSPFDTARAVAITYFAKARLAQGRHRDARRLALEAGDLARGRECAWAAAMARRCLALVALAEGAAADAEAELRAALAVFEHQDARFEAAVTRLDLASVLKAQAAWREAAAEADAARRMLEPLDAPVYLARARALAQALQPLLSQPVP